MKLSTPPRIYWLLVAGSAVQVVATVFLRGESNLGGMSWSWVAVELVLTIGVGAGLAIAWSLLTAYMGLGILSFPLFVLAIGATTLGWILVISLGLATLLNLIVLLSSSLRSHRRPRRPVDPLAQPDSALP